MKLNIVSIGTVIMILFLFNTTLATVWYVHPDSTLNRIQNALNACSVGDTVLVGPGTYQENIIWPYTQGINLVSESGSEATIIDGGNPSNSDSGCVVFIANQQDSTTVISGFTITNGTGTVLEEPVIGASFGGGICCWGAASPSIIGNIITTNTAIYGGGIGCVVSAAPFISNNIIRNNIADSAGGGILEYPGSATIYENTINNNTSKYGGGLYFVNSSNSVITYNDIKNNIALSGGGLGIVWYSEPYLQFNNIIGNKATSYGGGIYVGTYANPTIMNCTIEYDTTLIPYMGSGMRIGNYASPTIKYSTISNNSGAGIRCEIYGTAIIDSCTIAHNGYIGVDCVSGGNPIINWCNIIENAGYGIQNLTPSITVNAENNWWGEVTGPYHSSNPGGLGDTVSDNVDFDPWLEEPVIGLFEQSRPIVKYPLVQTTIVRGLLLLPPTSSIERAASSVLFDISGRKVMTLHTGANDIHHLCPGIYFVKNGNSRLISKIIVLK